MNVFGLNSDILIRYWTLTSLKVTFTGTFNGGQIAINGVDLDVHQDKTGLTKNLADKTYERKYAFGAPRNLCWKCDDQIISATASDKNILTARLIMPGVKLQPNLSNSTGSFRYIFAQTINDSLLKVLLQAFKTQQFQFWLRVELRCVGPLERLGWSPFDSGFIVLLVLGYRHAGQPSSSQQV